MAIKISPSNYEKNKMQAPPQQRQVDPAQQLLLTLANTQSVTIDTLQKLNQRVEAENDELRKFNVNAGNQLRQLQDQVKLLQTSNDELSALTSVEPDDTTDNVAPVEPVASVEST